MPVWKPLPYFKALPEIPQFPEAPEPVQQVALVQQEEGHDALGLSGGLGQAWGLLITKI